MQTSSRKVAANQRNAKLSTGPKTPQGKQRSSHNATSHGLSSAFALLPHEDQATFDQLLNAYRAEFAPKTPHESLLATQMAQSRWRLDRTLRFEAIAYDQMLSPAVDETNPEAVIVARLAKNSSNVLALLHRYAVSAERSYFRVHRELTQARSRELRNKANEAKLWLQQHFAPPAYIPEDYPTSGNAPDRGTG
jgi:hypothetical protein